MVGFAGAGKTTFAKRMALEKKAVRLTPDDWMEQLFPEALSLDEFSRYFGRVCNLVWEVASQLLMNGHDVILDIGFWSRDSRDHARKRLSELGASCEVVFVDCDEDLICERLLKRKGSFWSSAAVVREKLVTFERPQSDEVLTLVRGDG
jgi:hypothetical protein